MHHKRRTGYEEGSLPYGRVCVKLGLSPNVLTAVSLVIGVISGIFFWKQHWWLAIVTMLLAAFTDMLDGATARASGTGTRFGSVLDRVADRFGEFFIFMGILLSGVVEPGWVIFAQFGVLIASYSRSAAESVGKMKTCAVGIAGRFEKFVVIIGGAVGQVFLPEWSLLRYGVIIVGLVSIVTAIQRLAYTYKVTHAEDNT